MSANPQDGFRPTVGKEDPLTDNALKPTAPAIPGATRWLALGAVAGPRHAGLARRCSRSRLLVS
jgi:hypothetical protein